MSGTRGLGGLIWSLALALALAGCATTYPVPTRSPDAPGRPLPAPASVSLSVKDLPGWENDDFLAALQAWRASCVALAPGPACRAAEVLGPDAERDRVRLYFETWFDAERVAGEGVLTAYFSPDYEARREPDEIFSAPLRPRPDGLSRDGAGRWPVGPERREIETAPGPALAFLRPEDLFMMQIQGSGRLTFPDGARRRAVYAADNGLPFMPIARPMVEAGLLPAQGASAEAIRRWLADHRGPEAQAITDLNPRYVYFALVDDDGAEPRGAAGLPLPPSRAIAVDRAYHTFGELVWLDADAPGLAGAAGIYRRMVVALDVGGAIKGPVRADLYMGQGDHAGLEAGRVRHRLRLYRLVPRAYAVQH